MEIELLGAKGDSEFRGILFQSFSTDEQISEVEKFKRFLKGGVSFLDL